MSRRLSGINPLSYLGVEPYSPPAMLVNGRAPTSNDFSNVGDFWLLIPPGYSGPEALYVLISLNAGVATWAQLYPGSSSSLEFETDSGSVSPSSGVVNIFGDGVDINTTGSGNTIRINLDADVATEYPTNSGTAVPSSHQLRVLGGSNINTSGSGNTVTVNLDTDVTIPGDLVVSGSSTFNGTVTVSSFGEGVVQSDISGQLFSNRGTDGQILIASDAGAPAWANITSLGATVTITNGANSINLETGGGGGGTIISQFNSSDTWTKNSSTKYVEVHGWNAGGGGASGGLGNTGSFNASGGGAGGSYGYFTYEGPEFCFPATETITIGAGGIGGVSQSSGNQPGNPGGNGGVTTFGDLTTASAIQSANIGGPQSGGGQQLGGFFYYAGFIGEYLAEGISLADQMNGSNSTSSNLGSSNNSAAGKTFGVGGNAGNIFPGAYIGGPGRPGGWKLVYPSIQGAQLVNIPASLFRMPTNGGGGAAQNPASPASFIGGAGGSIMAPGNVTTLVAGGTAGRPISPDGGNGNPGLTAVGVMCGGTGGGGGSSEFSGNPPGNGGNGGFPGAGGGGGGAGTSMPSGAGGDGADGTVIIIEYT